MLNRFNSRGACNCLLDAVISTHLSASRSDLQMEAATRPVGSLRSSVSESEPPTVSGLEGPVRILN